MLLACGGEEGTASEVGYLLSADFASFAPPLGAGDLLPYQDEYSNELRNSFSSPHSLHRP